MGFLGSSLYSRGFLKFIKESQKQPSVTNAALNHGYPHGTRFISLSTMHTEGCCEEFAELDQHHNSSSSSCHPIRTASAQQTPVTPQPSAVKTERSTLSSLLYKLRKVPQPHSQPFTYPTAHSKRVYQGVRVPVYERVGKLPSQPANLVCELRVDVWPHPTCWMVHGLWPCYELGAWLVYFTPEDIRIPYILAQSKLEVKKEIDKLDPAIKNVLHNIWKSYVERGENCEEQNEDFWAYERVAHAWDNVGCPGDYFQMAKDAGGQATYILKGWLIKCKVKGNQFYHTGFWTDELKRLFMVGGVHLYIKSDNEDPQPRETKIPYLHGIGLLLQFNKNAYKGFRWIDHPTGKSRIKSGYFYFLI